MAFGGDEQAMLLAFIAYGDECDSRLAVDVVPSKFYDGPYKKVHDKFHQYLTKFRSKLAQHVPDIIVDLIAAHPTQEQDFVDIFQALDTHWQQGLNRDYVFSKAKVYVQHRYRQQQFQEVAPLLARPPDEDNLAKIDDIISRSNKLIVGSVDTGLNIKDVQAVNKALEHRPDAAFFTGIAPLDARGICPTRKQLLLLLALPGTGKSTGLLHFAMAPWWKGNPDGSPIHVLYFSLEQDAEDEVQKVFRARGLYTEAISGDQEISQVMFDLDSNGRVNPATLRKDKIKLTSNSKKRDALHEKIQKKGEFFIKSMKSNVLTPAVVHHTLDAIYAKYRVKIDLVLVDYVELMKVDRDGELRESTNRNCLGLREIARDRDLAMVSAQQLNREGEKALESGQILTYAYIEGSKLVFNTADQVLVYQQTASEKREQLARLFANKGRRKEDGFMVVVSQNYAAGRFAVSSGMSSIAFETSMKGKE